MQSNYFLLIEIIIKININIIMFIIILIIKISIIGLNKTYYIVPYFIAIFYSNKKGKLYVLF